MPSRPRSPYESATVPVGAGLNLVDAPESFAPGETTVLVNLLLEGVGRATTRRGIQSLDNGLALPTVGIFAFPWGDDAGSGITGAVVLEWDEAEQSVAFWAVDPNGLNPGSLTNAAPGWDDGILSRPNATAATLNQLLFVVDEGKQSGLVIYDPKRMSGKVYQPLFQFEDPPGTATPIRARVVASYNNMLFVAGYGTEGDQDRPEIVRFSYLGLDGSEGNIDVGDAGANSESENLFDINDYFMVGERGVPVTAMTASQGRLIIATERSTYALFGYDRNSFQLDQLDPQVGCVATRSMIGADGVAYWWSQSGPARYAGGRVDTDFGRKVSARLNEINGEEVFSLHVPLAQEVRFYHSGNRALCWNYRHQAWREELNEGDGAFGVVFLCAGIARESAGALLGPPGPPTDVQASGGVDQDPLRTDFHVTGIWTQAVGLHSDTATIVELYLGPNTSGDLVDEIELMGTGWSWHKFKDLEEDTTYTVRVYHRRNGQNSADATATTDTPTAD